MSMFSFSSLAFSGCIISNVFSKKQIGVRVLLHSVTLLFVLFVLLASAELVEAVDSTASQSVTLNMCVNAIVVFHHVNE